MNTEELVSLFKKYKVRIPKEKQGQSECYECKRHHKYSLTWTSFLYEYKENYYCFEHIVNILLQQENKQLKDNWNYIKKMLKEAKQEKYISGYCGTCTDVDIDFLLSKMQELQGSDSNE